METDAPSTRRPLPEGASGHQTRSQRTASGRGSRRAEYHDALRRGSTAHPYNDHGTVLGGIIWVARTGSSWREMPEEFGKWESAYRRYELWLRQGLWQLILQALGEEALPGPATKEPN